MIKLCPVRKFGSQSIPKLTAISFPIDILSCKKAKNTRKKAEKTIRRYFHVSRIISSQECVRNALSIKPNWYETRSNTPYMFKSKVKT